MNHYKISVRSQATFRYMYDWDEWIFPMYLSWS